MKNIWMLGCEHTCRWMGPCVLKASLAECWSVIPLNDISIDTWSTVNHHRSTILAVDPDQCQLVHMRQLTLCQLSTNWWLWLIEVSIKCQFSVERVLNDISIKMSVECWSRIYIDIQLWMPVVVMIQWLSCTIIFVAWSRQSFTCICRFQMTIKVILWRCSAYQDTMRRTWSLFWYQKDLSMTGKQSLQKWRMIGRLKNLVTICNMHDTL